MNFGISESDPADALSEFCARLRNLRKAAGGPTVESLARSRQVPLARAQIFATLSGKISSPPNWEFVKAFVQCCAEYAADHKVDLAATTDLTEWDHEYKILTRAWARRHREQQSAESIARRNGKSPARLLTVQEVTSCPVRTDGNGPVRRVGVVTGDIRQVRCANVWVNSENTEMEMARVYEFSISAILRYEGARRDARGRIAEDIVANELEAKVAGHRPLEPGSVVVTGAGELWRTNGVRHIIHAAAVYGEPGSGFQAMKGIGRCATNALLAAEHLEIPDDRDVTVLFPLLGAGSGGGDPSTTATLLIHAARNYLRSAPDTQIATVLFLAYTDLELRACHEAFKAAGLRPES